MAVTAKTTQTSQTQLVVAVKKIVNAVKTVIAAPTAVAVITVAAKIALAAAEAKNNIIQTHGCLPVQSCVCFCNKTLPCLHRRFASALLLTLL